MSVEGDSVRESQVDFALGREGPWLLDRAWALLSSVCNWSRKGFSANRGAVKAGDGEVPSPG